MAAPENSEYRDSSSEGALTSPAKESLLRVALTQEDAENARAAFASKNNQDAGLPVVSIELAQSSPTAAVDLTAGKSTEKTDCQPNPVYETLVNTALRKMYDTSALGNPQEALHKYDCEITDNASAVNYADKLLHDSGDRYNDILTKPEIDSFSQRTEGKKIGLGLDLLPADPKASAASGVVIDRVFPDGPADKAGLKTNDKILTFNGEPVANLDREVFGQKLMATGGKDIHFEIERNGQKLEIVSRIGEFELPAVRDMLLPGKVAYLRLKDFSQKDTTDELKAAILKYPDANGLVIDLRSNPGGLLPEGLRAVTLFNDHANIMSIRERKDSDPAHPQYDERTLRAEPGQIVAVRNGEKPLWEYNGEKDIVSKPVVVLTDHGTGSAAEIFAGALKDNGDAITVGEATLGKGVGQTIVVSDLDSGKKLPEGGAVKVTSFRYFTPSGQWLGDGNENRHGIEPSIVVPKDTPLSPGLTNDEQVNVALKYIEAVAKQKAPKAN